MSRILDELESIVKADRIMLNYPSCLSSDHAVNLHYYHAEMQSGSDSGVCNLGDYLSAVIVDYMLKRKGISLNQEIDGRKHLYSIGSILQMGYQNATIWGSGFAFEPSILRGLPHRYPLRRLDVRSVRGPMTRRTLCRLGHSCPKIYGDPAVLMPLIYSKGKEEPEQEYLIIPHYSMEKAFIREHGSKHIASMNTKDYRAVIDMICSSQKVISSSLHGIILAEAYGVPAVYLQDRPVRFDYKYADWYASTRRKIHKETDIRKAIATKAEPIPDLTKMRDQLLSAFPYDLWEDV